MSLTDAGLTPYHAIVSSLSALPAGSTAVVIGAGGLGHVGIQILRAITGATVIALDISEEKLALAKDVSHAVDDGLIRTMVAGNKRALLDVLQRSVTASLDVIGEARSVETARFAANAWQLQQVFRRFARQPPEFEWRVLQPALETLDLLLEMDFVRLRGRRRTPGRPVTYATTDRFLEHFSLASLYDLPGVQEMKAAGLLDLSIPVGFEVPDPTRSGDSDGEDLLTGGDDGAPEFAQDFVSAD